MKNRPQNKQSAVDVNDEPTTKAAAPYNTALEAAAVVSPQERQRMIEEAAYFRAEQRGFDVGGEWDDWLLAEAEIDRLIAASPVVKSQ